MGLRTIVIVVRRRRAVNLQIHKMISNKKNNTANATNMKHDDDHKVVHTVDTTTHTTNTINNTMILPRVILTIITLLTTTRVTIRTRSMASIINNSERSPGPPTTAVTFAKILSAKARPGVEDHGRYLRRPVHGRTPCFVDCTCTGSLL